MIPTPHIEVVDKSLIGKTVLMPGDPLRAKFIAENYLENLQLFNSLRGMLGYTGTYKGKRISVMGSGMGMPSIGIYSYELYKFYDVENIIRVGSCGACHADYNVYDIVLATDAFSESTYAKVQTGNSSNILSASVDLNQQIITAAQKLATPVKEGRVHSTDVFYFTDPDYHKKSFANHSCVVLEMEAFALFANAALLQKRAACLLTVSDSFITHEKTSAQERQNTFTQMMELALESV